MAASGAFFAALKPRLKKSQIQSESFRGRDSSGFERECRGIVFAESEKDVLFILKTAARFRVSLSPVSSGLNTGYGDFYPHGRSHVVLHLGRMNRILELNREEGWMRIQPGVTQAQVHSFLQKNAPEFFFSQTYWLPETSVLGNSLERGRTLFGEREKSLIGAKLAISSGKMLRTGFDPETLSPLVQGLNLHPLIFQSNLGVAVEGVLRLEKRNPREIYFCLETPSYAKGLKQISLLGKFPEARLLRWYGADSRAGKLLISLDRTDSAAVKKLVSVKVRKVSPDELSGSADILDLQRNGAFSFHTFSVRRSRAHFQMAQKMTAEIRRMCRFCHLTISFVENSAVFLLRAHGDPSLHEVIHKKISEFGYRSYRGHSARFMGDGEALDLKKRIKKCFDPKNVISPGKYGLL